MAVVTSFFGVTKLTGADSDKFQRQVAYGRPNEAAKKSLAHGARILKAMETKGKFVVKIKK
jgi:hypothetical protein